MSLKQKHILVVTSVYPLAATIDRYGSFVHETILHLRSTGAKFTVFAPAFKGLNHQILEGVPIYRFRYCPKQFEDLTHGEGAPTKVQNPLYVLIAACYILAGSWQLFWWCHRHKPDLIHVHWPFPHALMAFPARQFLNIPTVFTFHGAELLLARKFGFVAKILKRLLPTAGAVTANSSFTQGLVQQLYDGSVMVIPYGLTIEAKPPKPLAAGEPPRLLFAGRLIERKGLTYLLDALTLVVPQQSVRLRIVGGGVLEPELRAHCKRLGLEKHVDFLGFVSNDALAEEYASCTIFVLPSIVDRKGDTEGLGIVLIEAMSHQKPVIASAVGGIADVIQSGQTGVLVPEKDPQALAAAILDLLANPERAATMGQRGLEDVQLRFSWTRLTHLWRQVFLEALGYHAFPLDSYPTTVKEP